MIEITAVQPDIRNRFLGLALDLRARGYKRHSADAILHHVRWLGGTGRCNNDWTSALARWAMETEASLSGFFELRSADDDDDGDPLIPGLL